MEAEEVVDLFLKYFLCVGESVSVVARCAFSVYI